MRVLYIADPRSVHTQRWVRWFAELHDVAVVATAGDRALADLELCTLAATGRLPGSRLARSVRAFRQAIARFRPDVVHAHFINEAGWLAAVGGQRPFVVTAWGSDVYRAPTESRLAGFLNPRAVRMADWVTCDSNDQANLLRDWGVDPARLAVINWGVAREEFHEGVDGGALRDRLDIPRGSTVILSPRQWLPNSNVPAIVEAHARLHPDTYLIAKRISRFEGPEASDVEASIARSAARDRVRIVDEVGPEELPSLYAASDVVVSLCRTDGTPVSLLEAMATGRPVVALDNPSVAEWLDPPGAELVPDCTPDVVAAAIARLIQPGARAGAAAHNLAVVRARADRHREMGKMDEIYEQLVNGGGRAQA